MDVFDNLFEFEDGYFVEEKECVKCRRHLPLSYFSKASGGNYLRTECKSCGTMLGKERSLLKKNAPPVPDDYQCPICLRNEEQARGSGGKKVGTWCLDHDHKTKQFRGYLCHSCNRTIGQLEDDLTRLDRIKEYLNNANENR